MNNIEKIKRVIIASLDVLIEQASKAAPPASKTRKRIEPTLPLSFRLDREYAERMDSVCGYLGWTRTEFIRSAINELLAQTVAKEMDNLTKGE